MPGTTRYSATFDRTYEEDEQKANPAATNGSRRSRSQSWQANVGMGNARPYTPLGYNSRPSQRSSSTDSGGTKGAEQIPTRTTSKPAVKTHNNPFQFVKVGSCPLYRKPEEQLKVVKEEKKPPEALKEEEEEWQTNLDSWKSRRRKMSEDIFRRQEEIRQFETEEEQSSSQAGSKKTKTFSEMVESRANRGRTMSLCLISSPLELQQWEIDNQNKNRLFSEGSEENSAVNSEDEGGNERRFQKNLNGNGTQSARNGSAKNKINRLFELGENCSPLKDGIYIDSGLESISSSHRTGDAPDSCSDFSQDSGSSIDCDSPRASGLLHNINLLEEYNSKSLHHSDSSDSFSNMKTSTPDASKKHVNGQANKNSTPNGNETRLLGETQNFPNNNGDASNTELLNKEHFSRKNENSAESSMSELSTDDALENSVKKGSKHERSIESENEVFVDDFEELNTNTCSSNNQDTVKVSDVNSEAQSQKNKIPDCSNSTPLPTIDSKNSEKSITSVNSTVGTDKSSGKEMKDNTKSDNNPNSKSKMLSDILPLNEANTSVNPESHSEEKEKKSAAIKKNTVKVRKKKPTAKIVSVEISNKKADSSVDSKKTCVESTLEEESLNVVFQSPKPKSAAQKPSTNNTKTVSSASSAKVTLTDVLPVEQIAEEMEKLILQQLEEEERAKELSCKVPPISAAAFDIAPSRKVEPPKEKPPPPPSSEQETQKVPSLKRINSTKRIKKEIHKRRSNFLGIENADESLVCDDSVVPPPNALEQILKAEMELDRESMKRLDSAVAERLKFEEKEIIQKEQEIIATLETEEMQKHLVINKESDNSTDEDRIRKLKEERKTAKSEKALTETQMLRLSEEKQLKEREDYIRKQEEDNKSSAGLSSLSDAANVLNVQKSPNASSLCSETKPIVSLSEIGEGNTVSISASQVLDPNAEKPGEPTKPTVPPKPVKKKEAIRKERERLRQEQETLQKEREEHRLKLIKEQELLKTSQKPNAPVCRLGPTPPVKPSYTPKLTGSNNPQPSARENVIFTSQSYHGAQNGISSRNGCVDPMAPVVSKHKPVPSQKKNTQNDTHAPPQKVPLAKKSSHDSSPESKYNQNHWLIQEAEMRRIAELKERQHSAHFPQAHLAEAVCSNSRLPTAAPVAPKQDKMWSYAHPRVVSQKSLPHVPSDKILGIYQHAPQPPAKPSRVVPLERPEQILSISGRKRCSHCNEELGRGAAMIIESLQLYYHIQCFQCCVCQAQLGNGSCGTDVRVRNNKLHCHNCYSNDEAGLKFSQV